MIIIFKRFYMRTLFISASDSVVKEDFPGISVCLVEGGKMCVSAHFLSSFTSSSRRSVNVVVLGIRRGKLVWVRMQMKQLVSIFSFLLIVGIRWDLCAAAAD
ncbi:hypothetical protein CHARACLAT_032776 [Characodon lateralis]|uniref:Uncharacterized protein n=2 Tax=Goodeidae TaxID=28758 RepID=A0ABU7DZB3_9TELE|nr:hypothetical protein [Characodon lateralis]